MSAVIDPLRDRIREHALALASRAVDRTVDLTREAASRRTGALADGISATFPSISDDWIQAEITSAAPYSQYQDEGTGIYGPTGSRIYPISGKALRFDWPAAGGVVFFRSVAGSPGRHFFREPMPDRWRQALHESAGA